MPSETVVAILECALLSRAQGANGDVQPDKHDENYAIYVVNHLLPIEVIVG